MRRSHDRLRAQVSRLAAARRSAGCATAGEEGSAVVEFVALGLLVLVPVVYFVLTVGSLQGASFAAVGAADHAAKSFAQAADEEAAHSAAEASVRVAMADFGIVEHSARLELACDRDPCLQAGAAVSARVHVEVPLPLIPSGQGFGLTVGRVDASATQFVGRFR
ncbi:hypothetical protein [Sinomonas mesophila]|uniref:hypothetical protein n=1 Tax=Sinomonas mesophila TaxID=1531955 RepID=UPI001FE294AF|nr:hypothetical protein [Sinomonas mesophila]